MGTEVLVGHEWVRADEDENEIMEALESIERRGLTPRLRDRWVLLTMAGEKRRMKVAPDVIHAIREPRSSSN
jgi:hypothetical protein